MIKPLAKRLLEERARRQRRLPGLRTGASSAPPTVYFLCPDYQVPSGGIRVMYRHVDLLNAAGTTAAVLHHKDGFACRWFEHSTVTVGAPSVRLTPDDVLVVPEIYAPFLERLPRTPRLVAFNQNAYLTFDRVPSGRPVSYDMFTAAITVSQDSADYLRFAFPDLDVSVVRNAIDPSIFHPAARAPGRRLALMPRKRPQEADQVLRLLGDRLRGWDVVTMAGMSERAIAAAMGSSAIFLAFGRQEGFGLPAAEAMACGCYVIGFPGFGGRELFDPAFSNPIEDGDVLSFAREVAAAVSDYESDPARLRAAGARAAEHVRQTYSLSRQHDELTGFFARLAAL